jgi:hypothetical protein
MSNVAVGTLEPLVHDVVHLALHSFRTLVSHRHRCQNRGATLALEKLST